MERVNGRDLREKFGILVGLVAAVSSCHPEVSLGGDSSARGGNSANTAGLSGGGVSHPNATAGMPAGASSAAAILAGGTADNAGGVGTGVTSLQATGGTQAASGAMPFGGTSPLGAGGHLANGGTNPSGGVATLQKGGDPNIGGNAASISGITSSPGGATAVNSGGSSNIGGASHAGGVAVAGSGGTSNTTGAAAAGTPVTSGGTVSGVAGNSGTASLSGCLQLTEAQCLATQTCAAVPGPEARKPECAGDARGFSSCVSGGCRDITTKCNTLEQLDSMCSATCTSHNWAISPDNGCPYCSCVDDIELPEPGKGWDIAAWQEADGWHYSLVAGTNSIKTCDRVKIYTDTVSGGTTLALALPNLVAVKAALTRIAAASTRTFVSLCDGNCADIGCQLNKLPSDVATDIKTFATAVGLSLSYY